MDDADRQKQRERKLYYQLLASPVVEISGVVDPTGILVLKASGQETRSIMFSFDAWRIGNDPVRVDSLTIRRRVTDEELRQIQSEIQAETVVRIRARVAEENVYDVVQAHFEQFVEIINNDPDLNAYLSEERRPKTFRDSEFGLFIFDRQMHSYKSTVEWIGASIELSLEAEDSTDIEACLRVARELWSNMTSWNLRILNFAVQDLLRAKNGAWLEEDEPEITSEDFKKRMTLLSISACPDGNFEFWYGDDDMFWEHSIEILGNLTDGPTDTDLIG